jgi:hypothetical protein
MLDLDGDSVDIATNDEPADFQLQGAKSIQQKRPVDRQLDRTTNLYGIIDRQKGAARADVERPPDSMQDNSTFFV